MHALGLPEDPQTMSCEIVIEVEFYIQDTEIRKDCTSAPSR